MEKKDLDTEHIENDWQAAIDLIRYRLREALHLGYMTPVTLNKVNHSLPRPLCINIHCDSGRTSTASGSVN